MTIVWGAITVIIDGGIDIPPFSIIRIRTEIVSPSISVMKVERGILWTELMGIIALLMVKPA
jgi:hypothetical protein